MSDQEASPSIPAVESERRPYAPLVPPTRECQSPSLVADYGLRLASLPRVKPLEIVSLLLAVLLFDLTLFPQVGYTSFALLFVGTSFLLWTGSPERRLRGISSGICLMVLLLSLRMVWEGDPLGVILGVLLLMGLSSSLAGNLPYPIEVFLGCGSNLLAGGVVAPTYLLPLRGESGRRQRLGIAFFIPILILGVFTVLFILANPVLREGISNGLDRLLSLFSESSLSQGRLLIWAFALWVFAGLARGEMFTGTVKRLIETTQVFPAADSSLIDKSSLYPIARNTLISVVSLFFLYLAFEIGYIVLREIPEGFYYSGYAHQGAFWLTTALAFSTFTLGFIFRRELLSHPESPFLIRLTWLWSLQNLVLAACVYHRLHIYIDYNGMSRMRVVALYGILAVLIGFALVVRKVFRGQELIELIRHDLWALFLVIYLYFLTPVDILVVRYNVSQILNGNPSPSVQIAVHHIRPSGLASLLPLLDAEDPVIRSGVKALLNARFEEMGMHHRELMEGDWRLRQVSHRQAFRALSEAEGQLKGFSNAEERDRALQTFKEYAHRWFH